MTASDILSAYLSNDIKKIRSEDIVIPSGARGISRVTVNDIISQAEKYREDVIRLREETALLEEELENG